MKVYIYSMRKFEKDHLEKRLSNHNLRFSEIRLSAETTGLCEGSDAVCIFVNDDASAPVLQKLKQAGIRYLTLRSAGYNHVDLNEAQRLGIKVARVPEYSPAAIAEHTVALMLGLNRKIVRAHSRIREMNFSLEGLTGFDMAGKTAGIVGTGKIGQVVARILYGLNCKILAYDLVENEEIKKRFAVEYTSIDKLFSQSDIITLHLPLTKDSRYIIHRESIDKMKRGVMLINTSRGGLVNTKDVINGLKDGRIGFLGLDVYEEEEGLFFVDHSDDIVQDDTIARLMSFQNVLITSHQAFLTHEALTKIAETTQHNLDCWEKGIRSENELYL